MKKIIFTICEIAFVMVVPAVLIVINYSTWGAEATAFKIGLSGIILLLLVFYIFKKIILNKYLLKLRDTITQHSADLKVEPDPKRQESLIDALKREQTIQVIFNLIMPAILLVGLFLASKALESAAVKLSGTVGLIMASELIGLLFSILLAREVKK